MGKTATNLQPTRLSAFFFSPFLFLLRFAMLFLHARLVCHRASLSHFTIFSVRLSVGLFFCLRLPENETKQNKTKSTQRTQNNNNNKNNNNKNKQKTPCRSRVGGASAAAINFRSCGPLPLPDPKFQASPRKFEKSINISNVASSTIHLQRTDRPLAFTVGVSKPAW
jgi:hypothetical protein